MIDKRFQLVSTEHKHLHNLHFRVDMPLDKNYKRSDTDAIIAVCKQQYPELVFDSVGSFDNYQTRFPDGQYARGVVETTRSAHTDFSYVKSILFLLPLELDTIMAGVCSFKKAVPPMEYVAEPFELVDLTPEDFYEQLENLYNARHKLNLRIRAVTWKFLAVDSDIPVYMVQPTEYDYI